MKTWQHLTQALIVLALICVIGLFVNYLGAVPSSAESQTTPPPQATAKKGKAPAAKFVGSETCLGCHDGIGDTFHKQNHGLAMIATEAKGQGYLCEGCHGAGSAHADDPSAETAKPLKMNAQNGTGCLSCHNTRLSPTKWQRSNHHRAGINCIQCHGQVLNTHIDPTAKVKQPGAKKGETMPNLQPHGDIVRKPSADACLACHGNVRGESSLPYHHPIKEGRITCSDCHDVHRPMGEEIQREVCITCHAEQHGPFRYSHGAISGKLNDGCTSCHRPHGSPNQHMLKFSNRGLCLQCHADRALHFPGRLCWDCHSAVHGSNSSPILFNE